MPTLNQVVKSLNDIANNHLQINHFFFGEEWDFASSGVVNCPAMIVVLQPSTLQGSTLKHTFKIYFGDLVHKDLSNKKDVLSDQLQIALDVIYQLQHPDYDWVLDTSNLTLTDFEDSFDCELYGYYTTVTLKISNPFDRCSIPQTPLSITPSACPVVTIYNSDGSVNTTVVSGGSYTISGGGGGTATVKNSDNSYNVTVNAGDTLTLPDETINVYVNGTLNQTATYIPLDSTTINITAQ